KALKNWAATLIDQTVRHFEDTSSPRTAAFLILASEAIYRSRGDYGPAPDLWLQCAKMLLRLFTEHSHADWTWFEPYLSYDNYRLPEALIRAGSLSGRGDMTEAGFAALDWLVRRQSGTDGVFRPVATQEFGIRHSPPLRYDQQPIEAWAAIDAMIAASTVRPMKSWHHHGEAAYSWFSGSNDALLAVADMETGECYDGINAAGINRNRGAESVLAWQFARRRINALRKLDIC
ncbi:MAG: glycosyl transferase family 1, partial [Pontixanthobacter sp.]